MKKIVLSSALLTLLLVGCRESPENYEENPDGQIDTPTEEIHEEENSTEEEGT